MVVIARTAIFVMMMPVSEQPGADEVHEQPGTATHSAAEGDRGRREQAFDRLSPAGRDDLRRRKIGVAFQTLRLVSARYPRQRANPDEALEVMCIRAQPTQC